MSSSTVSHDQAMKDQIESMEANLKCPVCLLIPRELPIPCCTNGHIVCRPCKEHVTSCPTCRQPMPENMINSVVGALIDQTINHKCKYSDQGCEVKLMLKDLSAHEMRCPDRTVMCPIESCGVVVKLIDFDYHLKHMEASLGHTIFGDHSIFHKHFSEEDKFRWTWNEIFGELYGHTQSYRLLYTEEIKWHEPLKSLVLCMYEDRKGAFKYKAKIYITGVGENSGNLLTVNELRVSSVDNLLFIGKCEEDDGKYFLCIPMALAKKRSLKFPGYFETMWQMSFNF